jgi:hypothetical protein
MISGGKIVFTHCVKKSDTVKNTKTESVFSKNFITFLCSVLKTEEWNDWQETGWFKNFLL